MRKFQRGFGALELMICLIIGTLATVAGAEIYSRYLDRQTNRSASEHMNMVADAAALYTKDNYAALVAVATPTAPAAITTAMLRATGYLPAGFSDNNAFAQGYRILALEPSANKLQTLVVTINGDTIGEMHLLEIAKLMGARGGYVSTTNTAVATGSFGGWQTALAPYGVAPGAGHLATAMFFDDGAVANDFLYRSAVPGRPDLNRMNTAIDMNGNDLNNVDVVDATTVAATTVSATGNISAQNAVIAGETTTGGWFRTTGDTGWYNQKWSGGWYMSDPNWVRSYGNKGVLTGGEMRAGKLTSTGRTEVGEYIELNASVVEGAACATDGLVSRNATGLLTCQPHPISGSLNWARSKNTRNVATTAGAIKTQCTYGGFEMSMVDYDYVRYAITCGSRMCQSLRYNQGLEYSFGLVAEIGPGFNYPRPYNTPDGVVVTVNCVN